MTKLKNIGVKIEYHIELCSLFIRSLTEYCLTAYHSSLSNKLSNKLENIPKGCLKGILNVIYVSYEAAL